MRWVRVDEPYPAPGVDRCITGDGTVFERISDAATLNGKVVSAPVVCDGESDLLDSVGQQVDGVSEISDGRVRVVFEIDGDAGGVLAVIDAFQGKFSSSRDHGESSSVIADGGASDATAEGFGSTAGMA